MCECSTYKGIQGVGTGLLQPAKSAILDWTTYRRSRSFIRTSNNLMLLELIPAWHLVAATFLTLSVPFQKVPYCIQKTYTYFQVSSKTSWIHKRSQSILKIMKLLCFLTSKTDYWEIPRHFLTYWQPQTRKYPVTIYFFIIFKIQFLIKFSGIEIAQLNGLNEAVVLFTCWGWIVQSYCFAPITKHEICENI